jgi:hypothetical protein
MIDSSGTGACFSVAATGLEKNSMSDDLFARTNALNHDYCPAQPYMPVHDAIRFRGRGRPPIQAAVTIAHPYQQ